MSLDPKNTGFAARPLPDQGNQPARNFAIIDLGLQFDTFNGVKKDNPINKVMLCFEFTKFMHSFKEGEAKQPLTIFQEYSFVAGDRAKLPQVMKSWGKLTKIPEKINLKPYLGKYCTITVEHTEGKKNGKLYANIAHKGLGISSFDAQEKPKPFHKDIFFDLDQFNWDVFNQLPKYAQKRIEASDNWSGILKKYPRPVNQSAPAGEDPLAGGSDDDGPNF